ncbi:MAG: phosphoribosylformylglycinamidine synthase subunit PurL, partial [Proteobacteria bacterium]|nr:phosphoribosylformylglycinamidine synthase subunit PurL [Pseudomonadota bacterium]
TMASAEFDDNSDEKRPTVQVGDPFVEKLLIEACLELMATDAIVAIQDMGAAGLTSSSVEMAGKGGLGIDLDLDNVPARETAMTSYEMMLSESQERMLIILKPDRIKVAEKIFAKYELDCATIGHLTKTGRLVVRKNGKVDADMPIAPMVQASPEYSRPWKTTKKRKPIDAKKLPKRDAAKALVQLMGCPDLASRRWIWEQYDHLVRGRTLQRPGGDAAIVGLPDRKKALAMCVDSTPRYVHADPETGGAQAVVETWRNLTAVGATPLAITDNMNFGNPQRPEIMGQFVGAIKGMRKACKALAYPVVSGNVSLYNETNGQAILPTPTIGGVGILKDASKSTDLALKDEGDTLVLIGKTAGWLGSSLYLRELEGREEGAPPPVDLKAEKRNGDFVRGLIVKGQVNACHDLADGGLLVALTEMALAGKRGATLAFKDAGNAFLFGEDQARYVVSTKNAKRLLTAAKKVRVPAVAIGTVAKGAELTLPDGMRISLDTVRRAHEGWLPGYMSSKN